MRFSVLCYFNSLYVNTFFGSRYVFFYYWSFCVYIPDYFFSDISMTFPGERYSFINTESSRRIRQKPLNILTPISFLCLKLIALQISFSFTFFFLIPSQSCQLFQFYQKCPAFVILYSLVNIWHNLLHTMEKMLIV